MADVHFTPVMVTAPTGVVGTTFNITDPSIDETKIKGAYFFHSAHTSTDTLNVNRGVSRHDYGFTDLVNNRAIAFVGSNTFNTSNTARAMVDTECVLGITNGAAKRGGAIYNAIVTNGIQLQVTNQFLAEERILAVIVWGDDVLNVDVGTLALGTGTSPLPVNLGYQPSFVRFLTNLDGVGDFNSTQGTASEGILTASGQRCWGLNNVNGEGSSQVRRTYREAIAAQVSASATLDWDAAGAITPTGFTVTPSSSAGNDEVAYMAIELGGDAEVALVDEVVTSATTDIIISGLPFRPAFVESSFHPFAPALGDLSSGSFGPVSTMFTETAIWGDQSTSQNGAGTTNEQSVIYNRFGWRSPTSLNEEITGATPVFADDGIAINLTTNSLTTTNRAGWFLLIGSPASVGDTVTATGDAQAQAATTTGQASAFAVIDAQGTPQAQAATTSGQVNVFQGVSAQGLGTAQPASSTGSVNVISAPITASGNSSALPATTSGVAAVPEVVGVTGDAQAQAAVTSGNAGLPQLGPWDLRLKTPDNQWIEINKHQNLTDVGPDDHHKRLVWNSPYVPGNEYIVGDVVLDSGWTMVANKTTTDRAAPQPVGAQEWGYAVDPTWVNQNNSSVVYSGHLYTMQQSGWLKGARVWVPEVTANTNYRFISIRNPFGPNPQLNIVEEPILNANDWTIIGLGQLLVLAGEEFLFYIDALNSGGSTPFGPYGWTYTGGQQNPPPISQAWSHNNQNSILWVDKTDLDSIDRTAQLLGLIAGSSITITDTSNPDNFRTYRVNANPVDSGTYVTFPDVTQINQGGTIPAGATTWTGEIPLPQPTQYVEAASQWPTNNPDWATVQGFVQYDGVTQPGNDNNGYGVDLLFQEASVSEDWDVMAIGEGAGGGGGGSVSIDSIGSLAAGVSTSDIMWTQIAAYPLADGKAYSARLEVVAKRTDAVDYYSSIWYSLFWNDGGTINEEINNISELGNTLLNVRTNNGVGEVVFEVRGNAMEDWDWELNILFTEID